jgi:hypothetical protein
MNKVLVALLESYRTVTRSFAAVIHGRSAADQVRQSERLLHKRGRKFDESELVAELNGACGSLSNHMSELRVACYRADGVRDKRRPELKEVDRCVRVLFFSARNIHSLIERLGFFDVDAAALSDPKLDLTLYSHKVQAFVRAERVAEDALCRVDQYERMTAAQFVACERRL